MGGGGVTGLLFVGRLVALACASGAGARRGSRPEITAGRCCACGGCGRKGKDRQVGSGGQRGRRALWARGERAGQAAAWAEWGSGVAGRAQVGVGRVRLGRAESLSWCVGFLFYFFFFSISNSNKNN